MNTVLISILVFILGLTIGVIGIIALNILKNWFDKVVIHPKDSVSI